MHAGSARLTRLRRAAVSLGIMDDGEIHERINGLVDEEHRLRSGSSALSDADRARLGSLEESLDQCWDLLRQRQAKREAGLDPDEAKARDVEIVEHYRQ